MQFRKQLCLLIAFFLLVSNSGLAFNLHYCGGKMASISSIFSDEEVCEIPIKAKEKSCCAKPQQTHKKCCSDKEINLKSKTEKVTINSFSFNLDSVLCTSKSNLLINRSFTPQICFQKTNFYCNVNAPPFYQLYCQYTLYA